MTQAKPEIRLIKPKLMTPPSKVEPNQTTNDWTPPAQSFFQAVGVIETKGHTNLTKIGNEFYVTIRDKQYRIFPAVQAIAKFNKDFEYLSNHLVHLRVYPRYYRRPDSSDINDKVLGFQLFGWETGVNNWSINAGEFVIRGIWQFIPQYRRPIITVYRNHCSTDHHNRYKALHLPVMMRREDCVPFRFNPRADKNEKPQRWFIQARFRVITKYDSFGFIEDIEPPTLDLPRYKKPVKADQNAKK